jgi:hypothetical protein
LDIHLVQTQTVKGDRAVDAAVTRSANALQVSAACAEPHPMEQVQDDGFEEVRRDITEQFQGSASVDLRISSSACPSRSSGLPMA